jgi:hypothetical protein
VGAITAVVSLAVASPASADALTWSAASTPNPAPVTNDLYGVSCVSATTCMAVGMRSTGRYEVGTLVEAENGNSWSVVRSPSPGRGYGAQLNGVSCVSATDCTAVGFYVTARGLYKTLVESWDGTRWSVVPSPSPAGQGILYGVSCVSAAMCVATGTYGVTGFGYQTLVESWNGTSWSVVPSPSPGHPDQNALGSVSCLSATDCTAVGDYNGYGPEDPIKTLVESWDGTSWSVVPSPSHSTSVSQLDSVSCVSATACTAAGYRENTKSHDRTVIETGTASP